MNNIELLQKLLDCKAGSDIKFYVGELNQDDVELEFEMLMEESCFMGDSNHISIYLNKI